MRHPCTAAEFDVVVEVDLLLELPDNRLWAIEIKRGSAPKVEKELRIAREDLQPDRTFLVHSRNEHYPMGGGIEAISLTALADALAGLQPPPGARGA